MTVSDGTSSTHYRSAKRAPGSAQQSTILDLPAEAARNHSSWTQIEHDRSRIFPGYLFVALDLKRQQWRSVNGTFGVASLVMRGNEPHPVPRGGVETLIALTDEGGILQIGQNLKLGEAIRLAAGPFAEKLGILDRMDDSGRIRVLLGIFGRQVPVSTHSHNALPAA
jgi:transcriptional antiterminator RfaH